MTTTDEALETRLRRDLAVVAATITGNAPVAAPDSSPRRRRWGRFVLGIGAVTVPVALAAGAWLQQGPEYVETIPPETIILEGSVDGSRYLLVESRRTDACDQPVRGVELVEERDNLIGSEWNTAGEEYGTPGACGYRRAAYLRDPALFNDSGSPVGDSFVWVWAVHPDVTAVRVTTGDGAEDLAVHRVEGAGYAAYEVPTDADIWTAELVIGDEVVPGSWEEHVVPRP